MRLSPRRTLPVLGSSSSELCAAHISSGDHPYWRLVRGVRFPFSQGPVLREINRALSLEDKEHTSILFPIRIDNYPFDEWKHARKADVLEKVVGDFRNWKDDHVYQKALERLISELKQAKVRGN